MLPLREGDKVWIQNQGRDVARPNKWDRQGTVIAVKNNDQVLVKVHGSGRITIRSRRFLRKYEAAVPVALPIDMTPAAPVDKPNDVPVDKPLAVPVNVPIDVPVDVPIDVSVADPEEQVGVPVQSQTARRTGSPQKRQMNPDAPTFARSDEDDTSSTPVTMSLRRGTRQRVQTKVYDPVSGTYVLPLK